MDGHQYISVRGGSSQITAALMAPDFNAVLSAHAGRKEEGRPQLERVSHVQGSWHKDMNFQIILITILHFQVHAAIDLMQRTH